MHPAGAFWVAAEVMDPEGQLSVTAQVEHSKLCSSALRKTFSAEAVALEVASGHCLVVSAVESVLLTPLRARLFPRATVATLAR